MRTLMVIAAFALALAPFGTDKFYAEVNLSFSDSAGTHAVLGAVLGSGAKGITLEQSGTWEEVDGANSKVPAWAKSARDALAGPP